MTISQRNVSKGSVTRKSMKRGEIGFAEEQGAVIFRDSQ
jgi:hypothetical protein